MSKWCQEHWDVLRESVNDAGLSDMVSGNGEIATMKVKAELAGKDDKESFDPLMRAFWMIENRCLDVYGLTALTPEFGCPICRVAASRTDDGACACPNPNCEGKAPGTVPDPITWIKGDESAVQAIRDMCVERGWIK